MSYRSWFFDVSSPARSRSGLRLIWGAMADPSAPYGYGVIGKELQTALAGAGAEMAGSGDEDYDLAVILGLPFTWTIGKGIRRDVVWHTMFEAEPVPDEWIKVINRSGGLWSPSSWVTEVFRRNGVTIPIFTSGYGVDTSTFSSISRRGRSGPLRVLAWGRGLSSRKNLTMAIRAFMNAELADAEMEIKVNGDDILAVNGPIGGCDRATIIKADWSRAKVARWLQSGDVLLYLSGGEGFGLMPLEAMATGLPVICAANTGMLDYLSEDVALPVPCPELEPSLSYTRDFRRPMTTYKPDFDAAVEHLRWVYDHRENAYQIGERAASYVASNWTWEVAGKLAYQGLMKLKQEL